MKKRRVPLNQIRIGNVEIEQSAALAPMASVADFAYREMCARYGAVYTVSEMVSAKALCYGDQNRWHCCAAVH